MDEPDLQGVAPSRRTSIRRKRSDAVAALIHNHFYQHHANFRSADCASAISRFAAY